MPHEIDLLLTCTCIKLERIEAAVFIPRVGEKRKCLKHNKNVEIMRVGQPYWVDDDNDEKRIAGRYINK